MNRSPFRSLRFSIAMKVQIISVLIYAACLGAAAGLSSPASASSGDITIVGLPGGSIQTLPGMYVQSFGRWSVVTPNCDGGDDLSSIEPLRGSNSDESNSEGFVDPTSTTELWWPSDVTKLQARPSLDVIISSGVPSYASAGLEVRIPGKATADGAAWRNWGLRSQPLARRWTTVGFANEPNFRVECFVERVRRGAGGTDSSSSSPSWDPLFPSSYGVRKAMEAVGMIMSDADDALSRGFHVVSCPLTEEWKDLPAPKEEGEGYKIACLATAEPFAAKELLSLGDDLIAMTSTSILEVAMQMVAAGSSSQYLPDAYKPLYTDEL